MMYMAATKSTGGSSVFGPVSHIEFQALPVP